MSRLLIPAAAAALLLASPGPARAQVYYPGYAYPAGYGYVPYYGGSGVSLGLGGLQLNFGSPGYYGGYPAYGYGTRYYAPAYGYGTRYYAPYYGWNRGWSGYRGGYWGGGRRGWRR